MKRWILSAACLAAVTITSAQQPVWRSQTGRWQEQSARWERNTHNLLSGFGNMYNLHVVHEPGEAYPFKGWFFGWSVQDCNWHIPGFKVCDAIFHCRARSIDGPWEVWTGSGWDVGGINPGTWQPVLAAQDKPYDEWHNGDPSVVKYKGQYYMAYSATGHDLDRIPAGIAGDTDGSVLCVMGATSADGIHWKRTTAPILIAPHEMGRTEPEGDVVKHGSYHRPSLMRDGNRWKLWFDYWTGHSVAMGYAENRGDFTNPAHWKIIRAGDNPALDEFPNPDVVKIGSVYHAFGDPSGYGEGWAGRQICEAVSTNGLDWTPVGWLKPDPDTPALHVPEALVIRERQEPVLYLFYACQIGGEPDNNYRYDRIRVMSRRVSRNPAPVGAKGP